MLRITLLGVQNAPLVSKIETAIDRCGPGVISLLEVPLKYLDERAYRTNQNCPPKVIIMLICTSTLSAPLHSISTSGHGNQQP